MRKDFEVFDDEQNFYLSVQLEEIGDDFNDETFGNVRDISVFIHFLLNFRSFLLLDCEFFLQFLILKF